MNSVPLRLTCPTTKRLTTATRAMLLAIGLLPCVQAAVTNGAEAAPQSPTAAPWIEPDFPFVSSIVDARKSGSGSPADNLTPRGIILNLGHDLWACFDTDLLRVSAVWKGKGFTADSLAYGSYVDETKKTSGGQSRIPKIEGKVWLSNGIYAGWQLEEHLSLQDPREPAPDPKEVGRGGLPASLGRFDAVRLMGSGAALEYTINSTAIKEWWSVSTEAGAQTIDRHLEISSSKNPLVLVLGHKSPEATFTLEYPSGGAGAPELLQRDSVWMVRVPVHAEAVAFTVKYAEGTNLVPRAVMAATRPMPAPRPMSAGVPALRWPQEIRTKIDRSESKDAYVVDHIDLPDDNPWNRKVRPADIQFLSDGTGVLVTIDGDVWLVRGLSGTSDYVDWKRFASGLHEPMSLAIRDEQIYVFDRNGIWRLRDTDGNGEADVHEMFSNVFGQTADMREFPSTIRLAPGGEFVIAKGGQQESAGKHNGSVLRISADGSKVTVLGYGFRQPSIGVNIRTGLVTSSDQQGNYVPTTPLHDVRDGRFYGFLPTFVPKEVYPEPIADPLVWLPYAVNASALSQIWLFDARMGPLTDGLLHLGFNKPEVFHVLLDQRGQRLQASVLSITRDFDFPPINGSVNPVDGQVYIAGFQVVGWGNIIDNPGGLARLRYTGAPVLTPHEIVPMEDGVLLRFNVRLDPATATDPANYTLQSWGYRRTSRYGSAEYKEDGTPGQDLLTASDAYLAADGRSVFVAVPGMKPTMTLRIGWALSTTEGQTFSANGYATPYELAKFNPMAEGFGDITINLTPRAPVSPVSGPVTLEEGTRLAQLYACVACHATEGTTLRKSAGPGWNGLYGTERAVFIDGKKTNILVDEDYLRESILDPTTKIADGFERGEYAMPSFAGVLNDAQIEALLLYIKSLR